MIKKIFSIILFFSLSAKAEFIYNENCLKAYKLTFELKFEQAQKQIDIEKKTNPSNCIPVYIEHYKLFLKSFISEEEKDFAELKNHRDKAVEIFEQSNKKSPYYLLCLAEVHLQTAFVKIKFKEYVTGALEIRKAFKLLDENTKLFPDFTPTLKGLGILHAFIGAVPQNYHWLLKLAGMNGTINQGLGELENLYASAKPVSSPYHYMYKETELIYLFSKQHLEKNNAEVQHLIGLMPLPASTIEVFFAANIYYNSTRTNDVIECINNFEEKDGVYKMYYLHYLKGLALLNKLDTSAQSEFSKYVTNFKGTSFIKASYQRIAWMCLMREDTTAYKHYMQLCKTAGSDFNDEDKQALKESQDGIIPNTILLKARLLFDGGFYSLALKELAGRPLESFPSLRDKLEFTYRLARIYDKTGKKENALELYNKTITNGKNFTFYFAANSCLHAALLYENDNDKLNAEKYFRQCLAMRNHEYQNSIDQKAKAGLNRLGKNTAQ